MHFVTLLHACMKINKYHAVVVDLVKPGKIKFSEKR